MEELVSCAAFGSREEADAAVDRLAASGIDAEVGGPGWDLALSSDVPPGFDVLVEERDCDSAISVLSLVLKPEELDLSRTMSRSPRARAVGLLLALVLVAPLFVGVIVFAVSASIDAAT